MTEVALRWDAGVLMLAGVSEHDELVVAPASAFALDKQPVPTAGSWDVVGGAARFTPMFPPIPGTEFVVARRIAEQWSPIGSAVVPAPLLERRATVERIDPAVGEVPANLLRFSVTFSEPMAEGSAHGHVVLRDESGQEIPGALFSMTPELWDGDRRRLTVLLEPGRIKRGLRPNREAGAPIREGTSITLAIEPLVKDSRGARLAAGAQRSYRVTAAVRTRVDPSTWRVRWPRDPASALVVDFDRPLDRTLVARYLTVVDAHGRPVPGTRTQNADSTQWSFRAHAPHASIAPIDQWRLRIDTRLEDLAGNSVRRAFDRDLQDAAATTIEEPAVLIAAPRSGA